MKKIEITNSVEINKIINSTEVCALSMVDNGKPYCVPMNFGYHNDVIYFHGAPFGKKIEILKNNPEVCVAFYIDEKLNFVDKEVACSYSMKYKSVLAYGKVEFITDIDEKVKLLNIIMKRYSGRDDFKYSKPALNNVSIYYLKPDKIKAFNRGY